MSHRSVLASGEQHDETQPASSMILPALAEVLLSIQAKLELDGRYPEVQRSYINIGGNNDELAIASLAKMGCQVGFGPLFAYYHRYPNMLMVEDGSGASNLVFLMGEPIKEDEMSEFIATTKGMFLQKTADTLSKLEAEIEKIRAEADASADEKQKEAVLIQIGMIEEKIKSVRARNEEHAAEADEIKFSNLRKVLRINKYEVDVVPLMQNVYNAASAKGNEELLKIVDGDPIAFVKHTYTMQDLIDAGIARKEHYHPLGGDYIVQDLTGKPSWALEDAPIKSLSYLNIFKYLKESEREEKAAITPSMFEKVEKKFLEEMQTKRLTQGNSHISYVGKRELHPHILAIKRKPDQPSISPPVLNLEQKCLGERKECVVAFLVNAKDLGSDLSSDLADPTQKKTKGGLSGKDNEEAREDD